MNVVDHDLVAEFQRHFMAVARGYVRHTHLLARNDGSVFRRMAQSGYFFELAALAGVIDVILARNGQAKRRKP